jgi:hypothetical protein
MAFWRELGIWVKDLFRAWYGWVGGSATMGIVGLGQILGLWSAPQKQVYYLLFACGFLVSVFQAWQSEYHRASEAERKYRDDQPRFSIRPVNLVDSAEGWYQQRDGNGTMVQFILEHYGGRVPENIRFDPVPSLGGLFSLRFSELPFAAAQGHREYLDFEVWIVGAPPEADMELFIKLNQATMLDQFVADRPKGLQNCGHLLTVRYTDRGDERTKLFEIEFNPKRFLFTVRAFLDQVA